ncbi:hypothetical protein ETB97_001077, partial [Aspergillus alliaceus]
MLHQPRVYHKANLPSSPILVSTLEFLKAFASFLSTLVEAEEVAVVTGTLSPGYRDGGGTSCLGYDTGLNFGQAERADTLDQVLIMSKSSEPLYGSGIGYPS